MSKVGSEDFGQRIHGQVRASAARHDRPHGAGTLRGCHQGSSRARTGAEQPDGQVEAQGQIIDGLHNPLRKQGDVKHVGAVQRFFLGEQIEQQGAEPGVLQSLGDLPVAVAVAAAAAAMRKDHDAARRRHEAQVAFEPLWANGDGKGFGHENPPA